MKRGRLAVVILVLLGTSRLVAQDVTYDFDQDTDFSKFKSYKWVSIENAQQVDEITARQLTVAIDQELAKKGLLKTDSDNADLCVGRLGRKRSGMRTTQVGVMARAGATATSEKIYIGQLDLDMYDRADKRLVWRGKVSKTIDPKAKPDKRQKNIQKAIEKLLKNYPPQTKK